MTRRSSFVVELKLIVDASGAVETRLFGTEGWTSKASDTPANTHIQGLVIDPGSIRSELFTGARMTGPVRPSFGQIILNNAGGILDDLMDYGMGGTVTIRYGTVGNAYPASWTTVIIAYAYSLIVDFREVRILLRDRLFMLDKPVVTETFAGVGGLTGTGVATKKKQIVLGRPGFIPLVLFDQIKQIYLIQNNGATSRQWVTSSSDDYNIFDGGVPLTRGLPYVSEDDGLNNAPDPGTFRLYAQGAQTDAAYESTGPVYVRLGSPPEFDLRTQAVGVFKSNVESRARPWTFLDLLTRAGLSVAVASGSTILTAGNRLIDNDQTYLEVMSDGAAARFEIFGFNRLDQFFMANLLLGTEGSDASVYTFTVHNAKDFKRQPVPGQESPAWQVSVNAGIAWPSQIATSLSTEDADKFQRNRQQSFTGTADSVRLANPGAESATLDIQGNEFATFDQRKAFVRRYFELFGARRDLISVTTQLTPETIGIALHAKVTVNIPRLGCDGGRNFRAVVVDLNLRTRTATFLLWGGAIGPSDAVLGGGTGYSNPDEVDPLLVQMGDFITQSSGSAASTGSMEVLMGDFYTITNFTAQLSDQYWANVSLLVQGGTDGGLVINDLSTYASSVTITANATFESSHQVFGHNAIRGTTISPSIPAFTSVGVGSRFSRPASEDVTIECWFYYTVLENFSTSSFMWYWGDSIVGRIAELGTSGSAGMVRLRIEDAAEYVGAALAANTLHFLQLTVSGNTYYLDVNGTQVVTGTFPTRNGAGTYAFVPAAQAPQSSGPANSYWASPIRVTKGVARSRGSVPTAAFPTF
jgi:hypothetical protein